MSKKRKKAHRHQLKLDDEAKEMTESQISRHLSSVIKSARDIMRKDKGLSGDLDRLPMLTWIMFLKFLDDVEQHREVEADLKGEQYVSIIEPPYRWRDWASGDHGPRGDDLVAFIAQEEAILPNGTKGPGLFSYLRNLRGTEETRQKDVIAAVFRETYNRMISGYLIRDVLDLIDAIDFGSSKQIHVMGRLYETMLKQLRDAAGDSGEFYTPRPVVRFMVEVMDPQLGETILDPAAGTGGFLVESFEHLKKQCKKAKDMTLLQKKTLFGIEAKPLPYLLCQMNLLLHGIESPNIDLDNSLGYPIREIGERDRVDIILTNPPFGGEEERAILRNFPRDQQTTETALLFLQLVMRKLKKGGRCGMIVPDGVLSSEGVSERIREELVKKFNLHAIVRLPEGVFAPYTDIPSNLIFFRRDPSLGKDVWYYQLRVPSNRKKYTKTMPLNYDDLRECIDIWDSKEETENSWVVTYNEIKKQKYNLDRRNPNDEYAYESRKPSTIVDNTLQGISSLKTALEHLSADLLTVKDIIDEAEFRVLRITSFAKEIRRVVNIELDSSYIFLGVRSSSKGLFKKGQKEGSEISATRAFRVRRGDFIYSRLFARNGSFAVAQEEHDGCCVSSEFPIFEIDTSLVLPDYLWFFFSLPAVWSYVERKCQGTTKASRFRFKQKYFLEMEIPIPSIHLQERILAISEAMNAICHAEEKITKDHEGLVMSFLASIFKSHIESSFK